MNNQAAQTMPERPEFSVDEALRIADQNADAYDKVASVSRTLAAEVRRLAALSQTAGVTEGGLEAFTDYFVKNYPGPDTIIYDPKWHAPRIFRAAQRAIQAAAPAASGGESGIIECEFTEDGTLSNWLAWRVFRDDDGAIWLTTSDPSRDIEVDEDAHALPPSGASQSSNPNLATHGLSSESAASVSERLLALADEIDRQARECPTVDWRPNAHENARNLRAIEQALTQQRGAVDWLAFAYELEAFKPRGELGALHGAGMAFAYKDVAKTIRAKLATTTPQPGAEAMRELTEATQALLHAVCGETGFAAAVRAHSGISYPWPALDIAEERVRSVLESLLAGGGGK